MKQKRKENPYPRTFAGRLTRRVILVLSVAMIIGSVMVFYLAKMLIALPELWSYYNTQKYTTEYVRRVMSDVYVATTNNVHDVECHLQQPDSLQSLMERIVRQNPRIRSCGVSFVEDYYPRKGRWFCPYAQRVDSTTILTRVLGGPSHDYLNAAWFQEALSADSGYWSKPFFDEHDAITPLISYVVPIRDRQGRTVAVLGADLSLNFLTDKLKEVCDVINNDQINSRRRPVYAFILSSDGSYVAHPDQKRILKKTFLDYVKVGGDSLDYRLGRDMIAGYASGDDPEPMALEDNEVYVFFSPVKYTDWSLAMVFPTLTVNVYSIVVTVIILMFLGFGLMLGFMVCFVTIDQSTKPLIELSRATDEVAKGHFDASLPDIKTRDEIQRLRDSFQNMQHSLFKYMDELRETATEKASIENELKIAHDIQMSMLPKLFPPYPERHDVEIFGQLTPAKAVGGDLFDFYIRDNRLFFCIGDVSGKGVPASLLMAVTRSLFRNVSAHVDEPQPIVNALNVAITESNDTSMFVTLFVGVLDLTSGHLVYCNAGHDAPLLVGTGLQSVPCDADIPTELQSLPCDANIPTGVMPQWDFTRQETTLAPGTTIFLYTDGLTEAEDSHHAQFGEERINDVARQMMEKGPCDPTAFVAEMTRAVHSFVGDAEQSDDLTMLAIQYLGV